MPAPLELARKTLDWTRTYIAGVLNATPDSFSDGGLYADADAAVAAGIEMAEQGADLIDVGGESTRPQGATPVTAADEIARVVPVVRGLAAHGLTVSIDTTKAEVARAALAAGAEIVNDISGGLFDPELPRAAAAARAAYIVGHVRGRTLAEVHASEDDPPAFDEVVSELRSRLEELPPELGGRTIVDPGLGFGKRLPQNVELIRRAGELGRSLFCPVMVGPSRKRFIGDLTGRDVGDRDRGTVGAALAAAGAGAHFVRTHDVKLLADALVVYEACRGRNSDS